MEGIEWTKVKYTHSGHTLRNTFINLNINNERQDYKTGTECMREYFPLWKWEVE
jgi:hypothetical protein